jgi:hypothetical protein
MMWREGHKGFAEHIVSRKGEEDDNWWVLIENSEKRRAADRCCTGSEDPVVSYTEAGWKTLRVGHCKEHSGNYTRILGEEHSDKVE